MTFERSLLEDLTQDLVDRTMGIVDTVLSRAGISSDNLDDVLLVGGQTRSPHVRRTLFRRFGRKPSSTVHADHAVALGAAVVADIMHSDSPTDFTDILPASIRLGRRGAGSTVLLPKGSPLPVSKRVEIVGRGIDDPLMLVRGEFANTRDNTVLGMLALPPDIREGLRRDKIEISVHVSDDGLLVATARDPATGESQELEIPLPDESE